MNRFYIPKDYYRQETRFIGPLLPFVGGLLVGGLITPRPNFGPAYPPVPYYPPVTYYPYIPSLNTSSTYSNTEVPTYYTSINGDNTNIYPYYTNPLY